MSRIASHQIAVRCVSKEWRRLELAVHWHSHGLALTGLGTDARQHAQHAVHTQASYAALKAQHGRGVSQLEQAHQRLNEERKANLKATAEQRRLTMELDATSQLEPLLQRAQQERCVLCQPPGLGLVRASCVT